jgi:hypothetical protein
MAQIADEVKCVIQEPSAHSPVGLTWLYESNQLIDASSCKVIVCQGNPI